MKSLLTIFLLSLYSFSGLKAQDDVYVHRQGDEIEQILGVLGKGGIEPSVFCGEEFEKFRVINCGTNKDKSIRLFESAHKMLLRMEGEINDYYNRPEIKSSRQKLKDLKAISKKVSCIKEKMNDTEMTCVPAQDSACLKNAYAYVIGYIIPNPFKKNKNLNFCPIYWQVQHQEYQTAVIIHEISHLCGTDDIEYFSGDGYTTGVPRHTQEIELKPRTRPNGELIDMFPKRKPEIYLKNISAKNADSFEFWGIYGFCLPGHDCGGN